jgi:hypothetical protein
MGLEVLVKVWKSKYLAMRADSFDSELFGARKELPPLQDFQKHVNTLCHFYGAVSYFFPMLMILRQRQR